MNSFSQRFFHLAKNRSPLCLGLDPSRELMRDWGLSDDAEGLHRFCGVVMEAAGDRIAVVKPQSAFFERLGPPGLSELAKTVATIREQGALSIIDCKRGDVIDTMEGYAGAMLGQHSGFGGDAMTVTAYLGFGALRPVLDRAAKCNGAAFVVVRSSNSEGCSVQDARLAGGRTVADALADEITAFNTALGDQIGPVGAVVGETVDGIAANVLARLPRSLILAPGVGAQGASLDDVRNNFGTAIGRTLPSVSRSILRHGPSLAALREAIVAIGNKRGGRLNLSNRCNFGRIVKPHADLRPMLFAFPVNPDVKHRAAVLRIGTDHRAGRQR
jgi:orotidine-5'-phosphate decarboxylase